MFFQKNPRTAATNIAPIPVVFFDWDNTLMASADFLRQVYLETSARLAKKGVITLQEIPLVATKKRDDLLIDYYGEENYNEALTVFQSVYDELFVPANLEMLPCARNLLQDLHQAGVPIGIISNYTQAGIIEHLDLRNIDHSNMVIVGVDTIRETKPGIVPGLYVLRELNINVLTQAVEIVMIGDGMHSDMLFARNMHAYANTVLRQSSCTGILYNSVLTGEAIYEQDAVVEGLEKLRTTSQMLRKPFVCQAVTNHIQVRALISPRIEDDDIYALKQQFREGLSVTILILACKHITNSAIEDSAREQRILDFVATLASTHHLDLECARDMCIAYFALSKAIQRHLQKKCLGGEDACDYVLSPEELFIIESFGKSENIELGAVSSLADLIKVLEQNNQIVDKLLGFSRSVIGRTYGDTIKTVSRLAEDERYQEINFNTLLSNIIDDIFKGDASLSSELEKSIVTLANELSNCKVSHVLKMELS